MVPVVEYSESTDRRKTKTFRWMEMRGGALQHPSCMQASFACSFRSPDDLGDRMKILMNQLSGESIPPIHGVGDGASWIVEQAERIGGSQYKHLIDFFHLSQYLHNAFDGCERQALLVDRCKSEVKAGAINKVMRRLRRQEKKHPGHEGVASCIRYIKNRPGQFHYAEAIAKDLPIGSGLIESTNRFLIQKRLKIPGSWWLRENAELMGQLRVLRANDRWGELWEKVA